MKNSKIFFTIGLLFILCSSMVNSVRAQQVYGFVSKDSLRVGDTFKYYLIVQQNKQYDDVSYPDSAQFGDLFHVSGFKNYHKTDFSDSLVYSLQFFGVRDTLLPSLKVAFISGKDTTFKHTTPVSIFFKSEIKNKQDAKFQPLKPIFEFALSILPYIIILIILLLIAWYGYRWYKKKQEEEKQPERPKPEPKIFVDPLEELEKNLFSLRSDESLTNRDFKTFYSKLGDSLRGYFEHVYNVNALESTTRELIRDLDTVAVDRQLFKQTNKILRQADMVKFAKYSPTIDQAYEDLRTGEEFLTRAREVDSGRISYLRQRFEEENQPEEETVESESNEKKLNEDKTT